MKKIGIPQIAKIANVSLGTVDRALHGRRGISEATRKRILQIAQDHDYRPNSAARALKAGRQSLRIGVCIPEGIHRYFDQIKEGMEAEAIGLDDLGLSLIYSPRERLETDPSEQIRSLLARDVQALIICPGQSKIIAPLIDDAESRGIRVICVSSDVAESNRSTVVWVDPDMSGRVAGELMAKLVQGSGDVAIVTGSLNVENHRRKTESFREEFERLGRGNRVINIVEDHDDPAIGFKEVWRLLDDSTSLRGIYVSTANCLPVCQNITARNLIGKIALITTDLFPEMIPYFDQQVISASIYQRPFRLGREALRIAVNGLINMEPIQHNYSFSPQIVMSSNVGLFRETARKAATARKPPTGREPATAYT